MGCGSSVNTSNVASAEQPVLLASPPLVKPQPDAMPNEVVFTGVSLDLPVLCRDEFHSKYTNALMYRWRPALIIQIEGSAQNKLLIHFIGWEENFDIWVDMTKEGFKLAPRALLSPEQCKSGTPLSDEQLAISLEYFQFGKQFITPVFEKVENGREDRGMTVPSSDLDASTPVDINSSDNSPIPETVPMPDAVEPTASEDPDATFIIPTKRLPEPKIISTPAPVVATKRMKTPGSCTENSSNGNNSINGTPSRMVLPPGVPTTAPVAMIQPPQALMMKPSSSSVPSKGTSGPSAAVSALNSENPHYVDEMVIIQ